MSGLGRRNRPSPPLFERFRRIAEGSHPVRPYSRNHRGFPGVGKRNDKLRDSMFGKRRRMRDDAADAPYGSVERELAQYGDVRKILFPEPAFFGDDAERDGEIESRSRLPDFGRSEIDGNPFRGERISRIANGGADAFAAFLYGRVAQAYDRERRESRRNVGFNGNGPSKQASNRRGKNGFNHEKSAEKNIFRATETDNTEKAAFVKRECHRLFCRNAPNVVLFLRIP